MILKQKIKLREALKCSGQEACDRHLLKIEKQGEIQVCSLIME